MENRKPSHSLQILHELPSLFKDALREGSLYQWKVEFTLFRCSARTDVIAVRHTNQTTLTHNNATTGLYYYSLKMIRPSWPIDYLLYNVIYSTYFSPPCELQLGYHSHNLRLPLWVRYNLQIIDSKKLYTINSFSGVLNHSNLINFIWSTSLIDLITHTVCFTLFRYVNKISPGIRDCNWTSTVFHEKLPIKTRRRVES